MPVILPAGRNLGIYIWVILMLLKIQDIYRTLFKTRDYTELNATHQSSGELIQSPRSQHSS